MDNSLLNPVSTYNKTLKDSEEKNANEYFDKLVEKSAIDVELNRKTCKQYYDLCSLRDNSAKKVRSYKVQKAWLIVLACFSCITAVVFVILAFMGNVMWYIGLIAGLAGIGLMVFSILWIVKKINKALKNQEAILADLTKQCNQKEEEARLQMQPLNSLFDWNMQTEVFSATAPKVQLDKYFDWKKLDLLSRRFNYDEERSASSSIYYVQSGSIDGNPIVIERDFDQKMGKKVYTGTRVVTYTVTVRDSQGHIRTETRSQTLVATVEKPYPTYDYSSYLFYGNDAAPDLSFKRTGSGLINKSEKDFDKIVRKKDNKIIKMSQKAVVYDKDGSTFTAMANMDFEVLFNALDRDQEVQFRMLFTPLAQAGELEIIKKSPYGDDFTFIKSKKLNCIRATHFEKMDIYGNPANYYDFDVDKSRKKFVDYNVSYFKGVFFLLAPILAIPLYEDNKPIEFIYKSKYKSNYTASEQEVMANSFGDNVFTPLGAITPTIIKANFSSKIKDFDEILVDGHAFKGEKRYDVVPVAAMNGGIYDVTVPWIEYIPIQKSTYMEMKRIGTTQKEYKDNVLQGKLGGLLAQLSAGGSSISFQRGMLAFIPKSRITEENADLFDEYQEDQFVTAGISSKLKEMDNLVDKLDKENK